MKTGGIDGCKIGWLFISFDKGNERWEVLETKEQLEEKFLETDRVFLDMPIGLEDEEYTRECDALMRKEVGGSYSSSVFSPPIRPALAAPSYVEANMISYEYTEKKLSLQSWNITPKIQMVDDLLTTHKGLEEKVMESHPEHLFQILNEGEIFQKKNLKKGIKHRLKLIEEEEPVVDDFFRDIKEEYRRSEIAEDDIVDAMVLALFAKWSKEKPLKTIPAKVEKDAMGLPKAYHFV
jgi:predicted RNase H-like nuclease